MENTVNIVIIDDHNIIIEGIELMLGFEKDIAIKKTYNDANLFIDDLRNRKVEAEIVLMDLVMPAINGLEASKILKKEFPHLKIIILSMNYEAKIIYELIEKTGVEGYLSKKISRSELVSAIQHVRKGYTHLSLEASEMLDSFRKKIVDYPAVKLSDREKQIVKMMFAGDSNKEIAAKLFISLSTVETHRKNIYRKTDVNSLPKLMQIVTDLQLLDDLH